jgi:hypothetical protein
MNPQTTQYSNGPGLVAFARGGLEPESTGPRLALAQWWQNPRISRELGLSQVEKRRLSQMHYPCARD